MKLFFLLLLSTLIISSCNKNLETTPEKKAGTDYKVLNDGKVIELSTSKTDQFSSIQVSRKDVSSEVKATCKVIVAALSGSNKGIPSLIYDNNESADLMSEYLKTRTLIDKANRQTERIRNLVNHQVIPEKELLDAETELQTLHTQLVAYESKFKVMGLDVKFLTNLKSGNVLITADIPESQLRNLSEGNNVKITFNSYPNEKFVSKVLSVGNVVDTYTRSVKALVTMNNSNGKLIPGMYGQTILDEKSTNSITIPKDALFTAKGKSFVFTQLDTNHFALTEVIAGKYNADWIEILAGLNTNDKVVNKGTMLLKFMSFGY